MYSLAQSAPHFQHGIQFKLHAFNQQLQLTSLRDTYLPKEVLVAAVFFSITDSNFRLTFIAVNFKALSCSEVHYHPLWLCKSGFFPCSTCIPRRRIPIRGFVVLLVFKSVGSTSLHMQLSDPKSILTFYCTVRH